YSPSMTSGAIAAGRNVSSIPAASTPAVTNATTVTIRMTLEVSGAPPFEGIVGARGGILLFDLDNRSGAVPAKRQAIHRMRKNPSQARGRDTIEVIFEATARILERSGRRGLSTNAIAELAGISIGSLYHYFPSKEAVLVAMARRELEAHGVAV